jgi:hypothetical protein
MLRKQKKDMLKLWFLEANSMESKSLIPNDLTDYKTIKFSFIVFGNNRWNHVVSSETVFNNNSRM